MINKKIRKAKRLTAAVLAAAMVFGNAAMAEALTPEAAAQVSTAIALAESDLSANSETIKILLQQCLNQLDPSDPVATTLQSVIYLLDTGNADGASVSILLKTVIDQESAVQEESTAQTEAAVQEESAAQTEAAVQEESAAQTQAPVQEESAAQTEAAVQDTGTAESPVSELGLPIYEVTSLVKTIMPDCILVDVPGDWGNNASGRSLTSYSPVNGSGAISPAAGTLSLSYSPMTEADAGVAFDTWEKDIASMSVTTALTSEDVTVADLPARKIDYTMSVGSNQFTCETVCFAYDQVMYKIELMQGQLSSYDYFPTYQQVVDSAEVGTDEMIAEAEAQAQDIADQDVQQETDAQSEAPVVQEETAAQTETAAAQTEETEAQTEAPIAQTEVPVQQETSTQTEAPVQGETAAQSESTDPAGGTLLTDMGTFMYSINGNVYQFPTAVSNLAEGDLQINRTLELPYDFHSDSDLGGGTWTEIINTQYFYFENALYKEMAGVTNMSGYPVTMQEGVITALIDTQGSYIDVMLPGGVKVGSPESDIIKGFPEFAGMAMDGYASFRGNELLYACNVRDDGCNGYALIRNDAPYYSALTIICENGIIKEISFECLGSARATGIFL